MFSTFGINRNQSSRCEKLHDSCLSQFLDSKELPDQAYFYAPPSIAESNVPLYITYVIPIEDPYQLTHFQYVVFLISFVRLYSKFVCKV